MTALARGLRPASRSFHQAVLAGPSRLQLRQAQRNILPTSRLLSQPYSAQPLSLLSRSFASSAHATAQIPATATATTQHPPSASAFSDPDSDPQPNFTPPPPPEPEPTSAYARFKLLTKKYGWYALGMYVLLSTCDLSLSFLLVHSLGAERIEPVFLAGVHQYRLLRYGEEETANYDEEDRVKRVERAEEARKEGGKKNGNAWGSPTFWAELLLAYTIHKTALLPLRAGLTVAWTPKVVNWLTARGWIGKGGFGRAATHAQGKIKDASDRVKARTRKEA